MRTCLVLRKKKSKLKLLYDSAIVFAITKSGKIYPYCHVGSPVQQAQEEVQGKQGGGAADSNIVSFQFWFA
uniref:Uncharacterized protein n=1 Tax=Arundo donax TaxID=35708 RepID=A0A0A9D676_ARUDO